MKPYKRQFKEAGGFKPGDVVRITKEARKELRTKYISSDGMSGINPDYLSAAFVVESPAYDGSLLRVHISDEGYSTSLNDSRFEKCEHIVYDIYDNTGKVDAVIHERSIFDSTVKDKMGNFKSFMDYLKDAIESGKIRPRNDE